jgi:phosphatidylglycerol lysyltransferase
MNAPVHFTRVHYLLPSLLAAAAAVIVLLLREWKPLRQLIRLGGKIAPVIVPRVLAVTTFLGGAILLFSGATPASAGRLRWLHDVLPLPVIEFSHFFGSLAGAGLLVLARGLNRRIDAAYHLTVALLAAGILFSLLKAFDYEEALLLSAMLAALLPSRRYFDRRTRLVDERFSPHWIVAIALVVTGSVALGLISYGTPAIRGDMIWDFSIHGQVPRFLRATAGVLALFVLVALARLLKPARAHPVPPTAESLAAATPIVAAFPQASANLAFLGDKSLLFNEAGTGFVMYGVSGRSWVALGDPVAPPEQTADLIASFAALSDRQGGWPVFYKIGREQLYLYLDLGFDVVKLGEEARVPLTTFSLDGPERRNLRRVHRKSIEQGCTFEMVSPERVGALLPELRAISDEWLAAKNAREKRFSLGWFSEDYVRRYPTGVVRLSGRPVAFANVWPSGAHEELEVDLMRFAGAAPPGIMRYVLVELMSWGKAEGYRWFNLGMSPLSGLRTSSVRSWWNQLGTAIYGTGERFYNFQGIRDFKEWFHPQWEPRYLASPGAALRPVVVANIAALVAGGLEGVVRR